uniref:Uncharacterized protein LOC114341986 n=1 Tax=Diabrotica virgifera virgifera TaxID=50390 RepID=A0A6P7GFX3_DIAVI
MPLPDTGFRNVGSRCIYRFCVALGNFWMAPEECIKPFISRYILEDLNRLNSLTRDRLQQYAQAVANNGSAVQNCWGFIDGTARAICRPGTDREAYYSGPKHVHYIKYQAVVCPDGIKVSLHEAFMGRRHDAGILRESGLYNQLKEKTRFPDGSTFVLYGDQAYGIRELLLCPYPGQGVNELQQNFNASMSTVRFAPTYSLQSER